MAVTAHADREPLWEIALGGGALTLPDYRGSGRSNTYAYPFVLPYYRGEVLKSDENGIRGLFFESDRIKLDVSLDGTVPAASSDDPARHGMDDLDPTFQIGPMFRYLVWGRGNRNRSLSLDLPVRAAFAVGSSFKHIGYTAYPHLTYRQDLDLLGRDWRIRLSGGPMFGSESHHDYFYRVSGRDARPDRPVYDPDAGYGGVRLIGTLYHRRGDFLVNLYAMYDSVEGAVFHDSPLVRRDSGATFGFLVSWFLFKSDRTVETQGLDW
ncbi:putative outer membrane protein [Imhoffiella purpurea]|uniref:Putative outer membrane protein n=2 Tax=Imhoffiella purpurea TaxID=1249627 RepID=W9VGU3_9GAMM|nr:putative outer membrane protein [Imhoffiella purpurea]